jgi:hypothetical protein
VFRWVTDVRRGDWVRDRLGPFGGQVGSVVPRGFDAYARVLHRATDRGVEPVRWADVAAATGATLHPTAQWWRVARRPEVYAGQPTVAHDGPWPSGWPPEGAEGTRRGEPREWPGGDPMEGRLDPDQLAAIVGVLRGFTDPDAITAAFWEGSSWQGGMRLILHAGRRPWWRRRPRPQPTDPDVDPAVLAGPKLELPQRAYLVFAGALDDVAALASRTATADVSPFRPDGRTPSLLWPDDRTWCVGTEVDFDSTLVGGGRALIDAILADPALEAFEVGPDDSLAYDADPVN